MLCHSISPSQESTECVGVPSFPEVSRHLAIFTVHLPYGFSSIKLMAVTATGAQFGPVGYECNLLYLACLLALVLGGPGPLSIDGFLKKWRKVGHS